MSKIDGTPTLVLNLLGPLQVHISPDQTVEIPSRKEIALLTYLALEHQHAHSRESLMGLLWPDAPSEKARLNLRVNLSNLRKRLKSADVDALFRITSLDIQFVAKSCVLDTAIFQEALRQTTQHPHPPGEICARCRPLLAQAVALYRGPFLDGLYLDDCEHFDEWLFMHREHFRVQTLTTLTKLSTFHMAQGEWDVALGYVRRQMEIDPLREQAYLQVMQIHLALGNRTEALRQYERCRTVLREELGVDPATELWELHQQILLAPAPGADQLAPSSAAMGEPTPPLTPLPVYLTPFLGRQAEMDLLAERIQAGQSRLITLVGPGGIGKTRLAVEAVRRQSQFFSGSVYFVACAEVEEASMLASIMAAALGIPFRPGQQSLQNQLIDWLRPRRALLIIDNLDPTLSTVTLLLQILGSAPYVICLVTSHTPLGVQAEDLISLEGLEVPDPDELATAGQFSGVRLFVDRAHRLDKRFHLTDENTPDVVRICQLVMGQPLGLELAAAQTAAHSCREIAAAIAENLDFLQADLLDLPARHHSLRLVFEYSWHTLMPQEQDCFCRLSIFRGSFHEDAARDVASASPSMLFRLQRAHLIQRQDGTDRFTVHELLRQFGRSKLAQIMPDPSPLYRHYAHYFLSWLSSQTQILQGVHLPQAVEAILADLDDVQQAWQWAAANAATDLLSRAAPVLGAFYALRGMHTEGEAAFRAGLAHLDPEPSLVRGELLVHLGIHLEKQGAIEAAQKALCEGLDIAQQFNDSASIGLGYHYLARIYMTAGTTAEAVQTLRKGLALLPPGKALMPRAELLIYLGILETELGNRAAAHQAHDEARRIVMLTGNKVQEQRLFLMLGLNALDDNYAAATFYLNRAIALVSDTGDRNLEARILNASGFVQARCGNYAEAIRLQLQGLAICTAAQDALQQSHALHNLCVDYYGLGQYEEAYFYGQEALAIAQRNALLNGITYAQLHLGHVLIKLGLLHDAEAMLLAARDGLAQMGRSSLEIEAEAGLAHVTQLRGDLCAARSHAEQVLNFLEDHDLTGTDETTLIYLHVYEVLAACQDSRAGQLLEKAHSHLQIHAAQLDPATRTRYLTAVPANRRLMEIWLPRHH